MSTKVLTAYVPLAWRRTVDQLAARHERSRGGIVKQALSAQLQIVRFHDLQHTVITELAEMGVADHVLELISGHLSRRMRIDAKRQTLDALDDLRRGGDAANGNGKPTSDAEIETIVEVPDDLTSQFAFAGLAAFR